MRSGGGRLGGFFVSIREGFVAPLKAAINPGAFYQRLSSLIDKYGIYATALFCIGAWIWASSVAFLLSLAALSLRGLFSLDPAALVTAPLKALALAVATPLLAALADAILIGIVAAVSPRRRPLHAVFLVRASSLLPYTLRAPLVAALGGGPMDLLASPLHPLDVALLALGVALTAYGLHKSMGMPLPHSLIAALLPALLKLGLGLLE